MDQRFRNEDQDTAGASREMQAMQDESGFDRFAQAYFVREKHARHETLGGLSGNRKLMRDEIHSSSGVTADRRLRDPAPPLECLDAKVESVEFIDLPREQTFLRFAEADRIGQFRLRDFAISGN